MARLQPGFTPAFSRDVKRLDRRHVDLSPLEEVIELVCRNDASSIEELKRRHNMHTLRGSAFAVGCSRNRHLSGILADLEDRLALGPACCNLRHGSVGFFEGKDRVD